MTVTFIYHRGGQGETLPKTFSRKKKSNNFINSFSPFFIQDKISVLVRVIILTQMLTSKVRPKDRTDGDSKTDFRKCYLLEHEWSNLFCPGSDSKNFIFLSHMVSVVTTQLTTHRQYVNKWE